MSKVNRKIQRARERGVYVFHWNKFMGTCGWIVSPYGKKYHEQRAHLHITQLTLDNPRGTGQYAIYVEGEVYPMTGLTKRQAANLAFAISAKKPQLTVTIN